MGSSYCDVDSDTHTFTLGHNAIYGLRVGQWGHLTVTLTLTHTPSPSDITNAIYGLRVGEWGPLTVTLTLEHGR